MSSAKSFTTYGFELTSLKFFLTLHSFIFVPHTHLRRELLTSTFPLGSLSTVDLFSRPYFHLKNLCLLSCITNKPKLSLISDLVVELIHSHLTRSCKHLPKRNLSFFKWESLSSLIPVSKSSNPPTLLPL